ncbi:hypothetical protein [Haloplanus salinarum]|uniref:hypothetical protein n=1 Tax=Haloplanus salinarum TaxID=1912324 RepID=UPI00214CF47C|nr:hypothetical protein [Haloplanus salinarum]
MIEPGELATVLIIIPFVAQLIKLYTNPTLLTESPSDEDAMDIVDTMAGQAIALFALILVIIEFVIEGGELTQYEALSATAMVVASIFVMLAFATRVIAGLRMIFFNFQLTSVRYAGLVLFLGMYLILLSRPFTKQVTDIFALFLGITWLVWIVHEIHAILCTERKEWGAIDMNRREWVREILSNLRKKWKESC